MYIKFDIAILFIFFAFQIGFIIGIIVKSIEDISKKKR